MRYLLLQIRDSNDPMLLNEQLAFAHTIGCPPKAIKSHSVFNSSLTDQTIQESDLIIIGGSGNYSACDSDPWILQTLNDLKRIYDSKKPLFASCWGFQALARALGGELIHDPHRCELGTLEIQLTEAGRKDRLFSLLKSPFLAQSGHEDHVVKLPPKAILLASTERVPHQAYTFHDRPIYATQFHPELSMKDLLARVRQYPAYLKKMTGMRYEDFCKQTQETPEVAQLIPEFIRQTNGNADLE